MGDVLRLNDLMELAYELEPIEDWITLGLYLGVRYSELMSIEKDYHDRRVCKHEVLSRWLQGSCNCTWRRVVEVLIQMGMMVVADTIKCKYLTLTIGG